MSTRRTRPRFQPNVVGAEGRDADNARFRHEVEQFGLRFRCGACVYQCPTTGDCSVGWPNQALREAIDAIDARGEPVFCKAFEDVEA